jgi:hypothetical protein
MWDYTETASIDGFRIYQSTAAGGAGTLLATVTPGTTLTYVVPRPSSYGAYYWTVAAFKGASESARSNEVSRIFVPPAPTLRITSQSASLRWFGAVLLATTSEPANAVLRYREIKDGAVSQTVIASPSPKMQHRAVLYLPARPAYYTYDWTMNAGGSEVTGHGTFQTR